MQPYKIFSKSEYVFNSLFLNFILFNYRYHFFVLPYKQNFNVTLQSY